MSRRLAWVLVAAALLPASAGAQFGRKSNLSQEVEELKARVLELQRQAAVTEVELARLRQQVAELLAAAGKAAPQRPPDAASAAPIREAAPREQALAAEPIEEVDLPLPTPVRQPPPAPAPPPSPAPTPPAPAAPAPSDASAPQALYDRGYALYYQGHYAEAEASFQRFLASQPGGDLADNALYWIGECRYARGDWRGALTAFRDVVEQHPQGNKVPDALLKAGQSLEAMGDIEGARVTYREVARRFPDTSAATAARERQAKLP